MWVALAGRFTGGYDEVLQHERTCTGATYSSMAERPSFAASLSSTPPRQQRSGSGTLQHQSTMPRPTTQNPRNKGKTQPLWSLLAEPLPKGWSASESTSRKGCVSYINDATGERISWKPTRHV